MASYPLVAVSEVGKQYAVYWTNPATGSVRRVPLTRDDYLALTLSNPQEPAGRWDPAETFTAAEEPLYNTASGAREPGCTLLGANGGLDIALPNDGILELVAGDYRGTFPNVTLKKPVAGLSLSAGMLVV